MTSLTGRDRNRLGSMLALAEREQNPSDGERLAAIAAAEALLAKRNLRLRDLARHNASDLSGAAERPDTDPPWHSIAQHCLDHHDRITAWEFEFLTSVARFPRLSEKQATVLAKIAERLGVQVPW